MDIIYLMNNIDKLAKKEHEYLEKLQRNRAKANKARKPYWQKRIDDYFSKGIMD